MRVLFVAPEAYPFAKVQGLADVMGSLPKALQGLGHEVNLILPRYRHMEDWRVDLGPFNVPTGTGQEVAALKEGNLTPRVPVLMVDQLDLFHRDAIYGYEDDGLRFGFFCRAVLEACRHVQFAPDVIHCNDWQTALLPAYLRAFYREDPLLASARTLLTLHNVREQGVFPRDLLDVLGLPDAWATEEVLLRDGRVNFLKGGIVLADRVSTVSETYAREIQTEALGAGLHGVLRERGEEIPGILNGLDPDDWNPRTDPHLVRGFDPTRPRQKAAQKRALQAELGLPATKAPLLGFVGRLVEQKGVDLLLQALPDLLPRSLQVALLGSGEPRYEAALSDLAERHANLAVALRFDEGLARRIYAGSDLFLMPSRFEPCGLAQLISMWYGTPPVVRRTGGLADTVRGYSAEPEDATGFFFEPYEADALTAAVEAALRVRGNRAAWERIRANAAAQDFSWDRPARRYASLYESLVRAPARPAGVEPRPPEGRD